MEIGSKMQVDGLDLNKTEYFTVTKGKLQSVSIDTDGGKIWVVASGGEFLAD